MRSRLLVRSCALAGLVLACPTHALAQSQATASLSVAAQFHSRTSLRVSSQLLRFEVADPAQPASVAVDFQAGTRTVAGADVVLSIEPLRAIDGPGGAADVETSLSFHGSGDATPGGQLVTETLAVAGRWTGSGLRTGRLVFSLRAAAPGSYTVPVRFVLSTP